MPCYLCNASRQRSGASFCAACGDALAAAPIIPAAGPQPTGRWSGRVVILMLVGGVLLFGLWFFSSSTPQVAAPVVIARDADEVPAQAARPRPTPRPQQQDAPPAAQDRAPAPITTPVPIRAAAGIATPERPTSPPGRYTLTVASEAGDGSVQRTISGTLTIRAGGATEQRPYAILFYTGRTVERTFVGDHVALDLDSDGGAATITLTRDGATIGTARLTDASRRAQLSD